MSDDRNEHRLPPPAFPPGIRRRHILGGADAPSAAAAPTASGNTDEGLIAPDDPIPSRADPLDAAIIRPEDPIPDRYRDAGEQPDDAGEVEVVVEPGEEGVAVGMDLDAQHEPYEAMAAQDPHLAEVARAIANLSEALVRRGQAALRATPEMTRFEATLRAYCVGYLAGRSGEDEPPAGMAE